ncbi:MAG: Hsp70 family protein, partial [Bacteroidales bacterium]|nr:Hsp70 family protein [Bacteroidales bacterium]
VPNIVVSVKRLMGVGYNDDNVQKMKTDSDTYPFAIKQPTGGTNEAVAVVLGGKEYTPEQISAEILRTLKDDANTKLGGDVTHAVITVPAYFTEKQKAATKKAAEMAGIQVQQLLAEPTAAAISYGFDKMSSGESKQILVYDFGGGTFDLSILMAVDGQFIESGSGGDRWLGGDDIDRRLKEYVCSEVEKRDGFKLDELLDNKSEKEKSEFSGGLKSGIEEAKKNLSRSDKAVVEFSSFLEDEEGEPVDDFTITREKFEELICPLIKRTITLIDELLAKTNIPEETIDAILLIGGSSCIPLVRKMLEAKYGKDKIQSSEKPMLAVAEGAAILAQSLPSEGSGIPTVDDGNDETPTGQGSGTVIFTTKHQTFIKTISGYEKIIESQEPIPLQANRKFYTTCENQKLVEVKIYNDAENGKYIKTTSGFFTITENLPHHSELKFTFDLDEDEILSIKVKTSDSGKPINVRLGRGYKDSRCLSELSQKIDEINSDKNISPLKKATFISEIQSIIEDINKNNYSEDDAGWDGVEQKTLSAYTRAKMGEKHEDRFGEICAIVLLNEFHRFLNPNDANALSDGLSRLKAANNDFEKDSIRQELEKEASNYMLLINVYMFKLVADKSNNPQTAGRGHAVYDEITNALDSNDIPFAKEIMNQNSDLLKELDKEGIDIGTGTNLE